MQCPPLTERWSPIAEGRVRRRALASVREIAAAIVEHEHELQWNDESQFLSGSRGGASLLFFDLAGSQRSHDAFHVAERFLDTDRVLLGRAPVHAGLHGGSTGLAWLVNHVADEFSPGEDACEEIDQYLGTLLTRSSWSGDFDLILGLVGIGVYVLSRPASPASSALLTQVLELLEASAEQQGAGVAWRSPARGDAPRARRAAHFDLGVAHGIPGVIAFLAYARLSGRIGRRADRLLEQSVRWLLEHRIARPSASSFSYAVGGDIRPESARLAWCYGDAGVALALLRAGQATRRSDWIALAVEIATRAALFDSERAGVRDAGLCHGSAGLMHIFNRLWQETSEPCFLAAAKRWLEATLAMREPGTGIAGFTSIRGPRREGPLTAVPDPGFLTGASGIALALHCACHDLVPSWDQCLLLSAPGPRSRTRARCSQ